MGVYLIKYVLNKRCVLTKGKAALKIIHNVTKKKIKPEEHVFCMDVFVPESCSDRCDNSTFFCHLNIFKCRFVSSENKTGSRPKMVHSIYQLRPSGA